MKLFDALFEGRRARGLRNLLLEKIAANREISMGVDELAEGLPIGDRPFSLDEVRKQMDYLADMDDTVISRCGKGSGVFDGKPKELEGVHKDGENKYILRTFRHGYMMTGG